MNCNDWVKVTFTVNSTRRSLLFTSNKRYLHRQYSISWLSSVIVSRVASYRPVIWKWKINVRALKSDTHIGKQVVSSIVWVSHLTKHALILWNLSALFLFYSNHFLCCQTKSGLEGINKDIRNYRYLLKSWWNKCFINDFIIIRLNEFYLNAFFGCCKVCISTCCSFTRPEKMTKDIVFKIIFTIAGFIQTWNYSNYFFRGHWSWSWLTLTIILDLVKNMIFPSVPIFMSISPMMSFLMQLVQ